MLRDLLVHIPSERLARPVVDGAVSQSMARTAHVDAVSAVKLQMSVSPSTVPRGSLCQR
jgi:hypothetical protein